jgi:hypothetical protein
MSSFSHYLPTAFLLCLTFPFPAAPEEQPQAPSDNQRTINSPAQGTWQGLKFGSSIDEVRRDVAKKNFQIERESREGSYSLSPNYRLAVPGSKLVFVFKPHLLFNHDGLGIITLTLDSAEMMKDNPSMTNGILADFAASDIQKLLIAKYGAPIEEKGPCNKVTVNMTLGYDRIRPDCNALWRGDAQTVALFWAYSPKRDELVFLIEYKPQSSGL